MRSIYHRSTLVFGLVSIGLGVAILAETVRRGGGVGIVIGVLFIALGVGRIYLLRHR